MSQTLFLDAVHAVLTICIHRQFLVNGISIHSHATFHPGWTMTIPCHTRKTDDSAECPYKSGNEIEKKRKKNNDKTNVNKIFNRKHFFTDFTIKHDTHWIKHFFLAWVSLDLTIYTVIRNENKKKDNNKRRCGHLYQTYRYIWSNEAIKCKRFYDNLLSIVSYKLFAMYFHIHPSPLCFALIRTFGFFFYSFANFICQFYSQF